MTIPWLRGYWARTVVVMGFITAEYAHCLAECRGCVAALAGQLPFEVSVACERLLLLLDAIHGDDVPDLEPIEGDPAEVWVRLVGPMDRLIRLHRATMYTVIHIPQEGS